MLNSPVRNWKDLKVWIIGGSSGLGTALARELLREGARVAVSGRNEHRLEEAAGAKGIPLVLDASDESSIRNAIRALEREWGSIDVLVYAAGHHISARPWELSPESVRGMMESNFLGLVHILGVLLPEFLDQGSGRLVLISSVAGFRGLPGGLLHGPGKAALSNFAYSLYMELRPYRIPVHLVIPGFIARSGDLARDYGFPAFITYAEAARRIRKGLEKGKFEIHFPKKFTLVMKFVSLLPPSLYFWTIRFLSRRKS